MRPSVFFEPERIVYPPSWLEHIPFAFWIVDVLRPRVFVELGTHSGNSYAAFAQAVQQLGVDSVGYAVDTWKGDGQAGFYDESVFLEWKDYHDRRYSSFSSLLRSTFDEAAGHFSDGAIDLLHIDGCHTAEAVSHDFETWRPRLSERGVVLMHDTNVRERDFGAWQVWETLKDRYPSFEFLHGHGLGVLGVGRNLPPELTWLLSSVAGDSSRTRTVRQLFSKTGAAVLDRFRAAAAIAHARDEARCAQEIVGERLNAEIAARASAVLQLTATVQETRTELAARSAEVEELQDALADAEAGIAECVKDIAWHRSTQRIQETVNLLATGATAAMSTHLDGVRARARALTDRIADASRPASSTFGRAWQTLRALGVTPPRLVRQPRGLLTLARLALRPRVLREAHLVAQSGLFDPGYYARRYPEVPAAGMMPLAHFVLMGGVEGRSPNPLFDSAWYLRRYPDVARSGANPVAHYLRTITHEARDPHPLFSVSHYRAQVAGPGAPPFEPLQHYIRHGAFKDYSPHPLFDAQYYLEMYPRAAAGWSPLLHFLEAGTAENCNPHPLFDTAFYRTRAPELGAQNALQHYLETGSGQGLRPHPLFDPTYYLGRYRDVAESKIEPLTHFVLAGGLEGRQPIQDFDSVWYLGAYPDIDASRANPLKHFVQHGWREHRNPSRQFDTIGYLARYPDVAETGANPLIHYVLYGRHEGRLTGQYERDARRIESERRVALHATSLESRARPERVILCVTHVMPTAPRAGNAYRIQRMLRWLRASGYIVIPVVAPIGDERPTAAEIRAMADEFGNAVVCQSDGHVEYVLHDVPDVLGSLESKFSERWATPLGEDFLVTERQRSLLQIDRSFCTDALIDTVMRLQTVLGRYVLLAEYIWMSRLLPLLDARALKIIDTIDVFSTRADKVERYGVADLAISADDERTRLERADVIVAIQANERAVLESLAPSLPVITSGVDFDVVADAGVATGNMVLCVASGNPMNRRGLQDFIRFAWPRVRELVPTAELTVVGAVGESIALPPPGVSIVGRVDDLKPLYAACSVVINPAMAGTGVKIKTLEALSYLRPIVTWPNGVDGVSPEVASLCRTVDDWYGFAQQVADVVASERTGFSAAARTTLERESRPDRVYAELGRTLSEFFGKP